MKKVQQSLQIEQVKDCEQFNSNIKELAIKNLVNDIGTPKNKQFYKDNKFYLTMILQCDILRTTKIGIVPILERSKYGKIFQTKTRNT